MSTDQPAKPEFTASLTVGDLRSDIIIAALETHLGVINGNSEKASEARSLLENLRAERERALAALERLKAAT